MGKLWGGRVWLGVAFALLGLSMLSTFVALASGFFFDPDDYPGSYYAAQIPKLLGVLVVSVLIPLLSATASVVSILAAPRNPLRIVTSVIALLLALSIVWICWVLGMSSIRQATFLADYFGG